MEKDSYITLSKHTTLELKVQRSKFIANAYPISNPEESSDILNQTRKEYFDARHHPFAYVLFEKDNFRYNDDGEPSGSSGKPIYDAINKHDLKNILVVVTRYFGGIKLGVGGLKRAYFNAADECLKISDKRQVVMTTRKIIQFNYSYISAVMKFIETNAISITENNSTDKVNLVCEVRISMLEKFNIELFDITNGTILIY
ncbi:MAG: YigZ family protein [Candidatus Kapaibacterium sp.]